MRFGVKTSPQNTTWHDMLAVWQAADDIDVFESGWTFDHLYPISSDSTGPCLEGWVTLTALAQATKRLRVGVLVTGIHYRHPAVLANMAAALDIVSNGRLDLGFGAGWYAVEIAGWAEEAGWSVAGLVELLDPGRVGERHGGYVVVDPESVPHDAWAISAGGRDHDPARPLVVFLHGAALDQLLLAQAAGGSAAKRERSQR